MIFNSSFCKALTISLLSITCLFSVTHAEDSEVIQYSTIEALLGRIFIGEMTLEELSEDADFGIGTYNDLDGEMVFIDGTFYQISGDGSVHEMPPQTLTPFATVCEWDDEDAVTIQPLPEGLSYDVLQQNIDHAIPSPNLFYAIKIEGTFQKLTARSVHPEKKPYPALADIIKKQSIFEFENVKGTLVGFRCPLYSKGVNVPGYHCHFLTEDKKAGGHVLKLVTGGDLKVSYLKLTEWEVILPETKDFLEAPLGQDIDDSVGKAINAIEKPQ